MNLLFFFAFTIFASAKNSDIQIQFNSTPQTLKQSDQNYEIPQTDTLKPSSSVLPESDARNSAFESAGLEKTLNDWTESERNLLYLRAQNRKPAELIQYYPKIQKDKLLKLQSWIQNSTKRSPSQAK